MTFSEPDIIKALQRLEVLPPDRPYHVDSGRHTPADPTRGAGAEELLLRCASRLRSKNPDLLANDIEILRRQLPATRSDQALRRYREIISEQQLLDQNLPVTPSLRADFYDALLQLAFPAPLGYQAYCALETCISGGRLHEPLARVVLGHDLAGLCVPMLVHREIRDKNPKQVIHDQRMTTDDLIAIAGSSDILPSVFGGR